MNQEKLLSDVRKQIKILQDRRRRRDLTAYEAEYLDLLLDVRKYPKLLDAAKKKYPNACEKCLGVGGHTTHGSREEPPSYDPCSCVEGGNCPRCGKGLTMIPQSHYDHMLCNHCGWDEHINCGAVLPEQPEGVIFGTVPDRTEL